MDRLKELLVFDETLGRFFWRTRPRSWGKQKSLEAGSYDAHGYGQVNINGEIHKEHRLVWFYKTGEWPSSQIDHINHKRRDNRFENLRLANNAENHRNRPMQKNNSSGFVGVSFCKRTQCYEAYITVDNVRHRLGRYKEVQEAISARRTANLAFGFHENHGVGFGISRKPRITPESS